MKREIRTISDVQFLVDSFYARASTDDLLGPIFINVIDSRSYKEMLYLYWNNVLLEGNSKEKEPFPHHIEQMFSTQHFIRWLTLLLETIDLHYYGSTADNAKIMLIRKSEEFQNRLELFRF